MTEIQWLTSQNSFEMLKDFPEYHGQRKLTLFACACLRRAWSAIRNPRTKQFVELVEQFAGREPDSPDLCRLWYEIEESSYEVTESGPIDEYEIVRDLFCYSGPNAASGIALTIACEVNHGKDDADGSSKQDERAFQAKLLRDIFGNPFRPISIDPRWLEWNDGTAVKLARTIYEDRRFDLMPILGDALEDAGCDSAAMLDHCRGPGPHVRGCWVVDLILGKQ